MLVDTAFTSSNEVLSYLDTCMSGFSNELFLFIHSLYIAQVHALYHLQLLFRVLRLGYMS